VRDIRALRRFIASGEQYDHYAPSLHVIHAISRSRIDLELAHAIAESTTQPRIAGRETFDPCLNPRASNAIAQAINPFAEGPRSLYPHRLL
jgi:hypothetical protein